MSVIQWILPAIAGGLLGAMLSIALGSVLRYPHWIYRYLVSIPIGAGFAMLAVVFAKVIA